MAGETDNFLATIDLTDYGPNASHFCSVIYL